MRRLLLTLCLATVLHAQEPAAAPHTFTSTDGRKLTAIIVSKTDTTVTVRRAEDGQEFVLPLERISAEDQAFVKVWGKKAKVAPTNNEARQALDDARKFTASGEYAKALERHEWFHENSREAPGMGGVRVSYALSDWVSLGLKYPPALDSLKKVRDASTQTLLSGAGTWGLFQDVRSINRALSKTGKVDNADTLKLFKQLDASQPELAKRCFGVVKKDLIATNDTELFAKHAGDLKGYLTRAVENHLYVTVEKKKGTDSGYIKLLDRELNELTAFMAQIAKSKGDAALADELLAMTAKVVTTVPVPVVADPALPESWVVQPKYDEAMEFVRLPETKGMMFSTFQKEPAKNERGNTSTRDRRIGLIRSDGLVLFDPDKDESLPPHYFWAPGSFSSKNIAHYFRDHRVLPMLSGGKYGLVDVDGRQVVPPQWDDIGEYSEGLFSFRLAGKEGYANLKGEVLIQPQWTEARAFSGGYALVWGGARWSVIDKSGKVVSEIEWEDIRALGAFGSAVFPDHVSMLDYRPA